MQGQGRSSFAYLKEEDCPVTVVVAVILERTSFSRGVCVGQLPLDTHGDSILVIILRGCKRDNYTECVKRPGQENQEGPFSLCKNYADGVIKNFSKFVVFHVLFCWQ